jgi:hypothetical protein
MKIQKQKTIYMFKINFFKVQVSTGLFCDKFLSSFLVFLIALIVPLPGSGSLAWQLFL